MKKVFIITGPTSSGKTSLSYKLSKDLNAEIISADSRQIYKYMDIGTGKLPIKTNIHISRHETYWEFGSTPIWGYDLITPDQTYSAYDFALFALNKTREIINKGKNVIIAGGTGFYIDLYTKNVIPSKVLPDPNIRSELEGLDLSSLQRKLQELNPQEYAKTDLNNRVRVIRAIERNHPQSTHNLQNELPYLENVEFLYAGLNSSRDVLYSRSDAWVDSIWKNGLTSETENLVHMGFGDTPRMKGLVYKTAVDHVSGLISAKDAVQRIKFDVHAYIRRQQTYLKKIKQINWFDISEDYLDEKVYNFFKETT